MKNLALNYKLHFSSAEIRMFTELLKNRSPKNLGTITQSYTDEPKYDQQHAAKMIATLVTTVQVRGI